MFVLILAGSEPEACMVAAGDLRLTSRAAWRYIDAAADVPGHPGDDLRYWATAGFFRRSDAQEILRAVQQRQISYYAPPHLIRR